MRLRQEDITKSNYSKYKKGIFTVIPTFTIVCFIPSVHFSDFFYVNNRLWFEIYSNR